jgi:CO/xanthine dehydrogenase FAD-binding subunit
VRGDAEAATLLRPRTPDEAMRLLGRHEGALPLAGGTDLMVAWNAGGLAGRTFVDLSRLDSWREIRATPHSLSIGALVTHTQLVRHALVRRRLPLLAAACATVGGVQIQNRGTLGGNLANASPAGDTFPPLAVHEAVVHTVSARGRRELALEAFFTGPKRTCLEPGELIESVAVPLPRQTPARARFRKVGTRAAQAISKVVAAGLLWTGRNGRVEELRFAVGSVAPTVRRLRSAEEAVRGERLTPAVVREACARVERDIAPIDDVRSTAEYRLAVSRSLLGAFLSG